MCEYVDVSPEDLQGLPLSHEQEFMIKLVAGTHPISKAPYGMTSVELVDPKK